MMTSAENWKSFFGDWPMGFPRQGIVITNQNEAMPFRSFWLKDHILLLERTVPDALGGRFVLLGFEAINSVKMINPISADTITQAGFAETATQELQRSY